MKAARSTGEAYLDGIQTQGSYSLQSVSPIWWRYPEVMQAASVSSSQSEQEGLVDAQTAFVLFMVGRD